MTPDPTADLRRTVAAMLIAVAVAVAAAKVCGAELLYEPSRFAAPTADGYGYDKEVTRKWPGTRPEPTPMFGSNDRSRWATVRALVDNGTYVVGQRENFRESTGYTDRGILFDPGYETLDKVMNPATGEFYSSKPPLLATVLAGEYWLLKRTLNWDIVRDRFLVVPAILLTVNVLPFAVYLMLLWKLIDAHGRTDFGKLLALATAALATFLTTFAGTLNNHSPAAYCALFAVYPLLKPRTGVMTSLSLAASGFFAGLTVMLELPAAALFAGLFLPTLWLWPRRTLLAFLPVALLPVGFGLACNYAALGTVLPAYSDFGGPWYEFPGSYWAKLKLGVPQRGIDFATEPRGVYLFHMLLGHHGWFSLTPVWLVGLVGTAATLRAGLADARGLLNRTNTWTGPLVLGLTLLLTATLTVFFVFVQKTNNYGGFTSGLRWFFWLTPFWALAAAVGADALSTRRAGRWFCILALAASAFSVHYPAANPWRYPWAQQLLDRLNYVRY